MTPLYQMDRRGFLRVGGAGVTASFVVPGGGTAKGSSEGGPLPGRGKAKSVLVVMLTGGPSQLDTVDPKPEAPAEVRGEFNTISTKIPGVAFCEHLPMLAARADRWSILRTMAHREQNHLLATHVALTGRPTPLPRGGSDLDRVESRSDFPNMAAALNFVKPRNDGIPSGVSLPNYYIEGPLTWPGQHSGFIGPKHDPWQIQGDPNAPDFKMHALSMREGMTPGRLTSRRGLLESLNRGSSGQLTGEADSYRDQRQIAIQLLTSGRVVEAFEINRESDETRERYGRNKFGQSLLLSRRLIEVGIPIVQATMGIVQTWDTHVDNWGRLKNTLLPDLDRGLAALMDDLQTSGLLEQTMVVVMGEFGRTPRISTLPGSNEPGRDHWAHTYSGLLAGAGVVGGQVIGQSDEVAGYPVTRAWSPADVGTTLFRALGVDPEVEVVDPLGRPNRLLNGVVIDPLYG